MKKIISLFLSLVFLLSSLSMLSFATDLAETDEGQESALGNIAINGIAYASGEKNTLWTPAKALNDGKYSKDTWQGWECKYPNIVIGSDTSAGFSGEYCGVKFTNREYYEIYEMHFNLGMHAAQGGQNPKYTVQCLVEGVWVTVAEFHDSDATPINFTSYEDAMKNDTDFYHIGADYHITLKEPVTTNNVRVNLSEYGKNYPGGDVLIFPYIYEIELTGKLGKTPDLELPEGAIISTNIAYHSYPECSTASSFAYPYLAIDGDKNTSWSPRKKQAGEYLVIKLLEAKKMNKVVVNFGEYLEGMSIIDYTFDIEGYINNEWVKLASGTSFDEENKTLITEYSFNEVETNQIRLIFTSSYTKAPKVYELETHLSTEKTYYVEGRYTDNQILSASKGNIAIIGTPYASADFIPYSSVDYINDGRFGENDYVWFSGVVDMPMYSGIKFSEKHLVNKVAVYVQSAEFEGEDIMGIEIQALIDGEYVTLVKAKSYHKITKYTTVYEFEAVETDDIRIKYTSGNGTFANLKELEIYSPDGIVPIFEGLEPLDETPQAPQEPIEETIVKVPSVKPTTDSVESMVAGKEIVNPLVTPTVNTIIESNVSEIKPTITTEPIVENTTFEIKLILIASVIVTVISGMAIALYLKKRSK